MPTGEIALLHAQQFEGHHQVKIKNVSPPLNAQTIKLVSNKANFNGIEFPPKLSWKGWEPGKEYTKNIVLKNLGLKIQKLKYRVPETKSFTTSYPKPIFLSPGASFTLPITFRPLEKVACSDKVVFFQKNGAEFEVPLKAMLPHIDISLPAHLDFKTCAVEDHILIMFDVFNIGDVDTFLKWEVSEPFTIEPAEAELKFKSSTKFQAMFKPNAAVVCEVVAVCRFGKDFELAGETTLFGIGKFPRLMVTCLGETAASTNQDKSTAAELEINFKSVAVGMTAEMSMEIHNLSQVQTPFHIERVPGMVHLNTVFRCLETEGIVPPMSFLKIPVTYIPHTVGLTSLDYFRVISHGNISHSIIKCVGTATGPSVELSTCCINFHVVDLGGSAVKPFDIINKSNVGAVFQFELDCEESVFKFPVTNGVILPQSKQTILLKFVPHAPINFYRRVTCLVHNQNPLYLDLLGTCHSESVKPAIIKKQHLSRYWTHVQRGLSVIAPEQLSEFEQTGRLRVDENGCLDLVYNDDKATLTTNPNPKDILPVDEYLNDGFHCDLINILPHVNLDVNVLDFGRVQSMNTPLDKTVNVTNHTKGKVTVHWMGDSSHIFSVSPATLDIPPLKSCSFRVTFKAAAPNKMYGNELECFVYYKSQRDFKMVQDRTLCPPWCLTVKCLGHTFFPNNETYLPRAAIEPQVVVFPAINVGESIHQTMVLFNEGDTPILYDLTPSFRSEVTTKEKCGTTPGKDVFLVKPNKGLLAPGYQVFTLRMAPTSVHTFTHDMVIRLNDNEKYNQAVHLCGSAECAEVVLDGEGNLYFKPTCAGTSCSRTYSFKNTSRIPLRFIWKLNKEDEQIVKVNPSFGVVQPNETVSQTWTFIPSEEKKYILKATLVAWGQGLSALSSGGKKKYFSLRIIGQGLLGDLQADQTAVDFGDILVGSSATHTFAVYNNSDCSLHYRFIIDCDNYENIQIGKQKVAKDKSRPDVEFDSMEGEVPARGKDSIMVTIRPAKRIHYQYAVCYQLITPFKVLVYHHKLDATCLNFTCLTDCESYAQTGTVLHPAVQEPQHLLYLMATGVYPSMSVCDIHAHGSGIGLSKKTLWNLFSLNDLNMYLESDPSPGELGSGTDIQHRTGFQLPSMTRKVLDFNFSAAPLGSDPCTVTIIVENSRTVLCEWALLFPKDTQVEMVHWATSGECNQDELNEMKVVDNKLFEVNPTKGALKPGETVAVTLAYQHTLVGTNRLPMVLRIAKGREILLNFIGVTVDHFQPYIHFPSNKHTFHPMPIGEKASHKQVYDLYNGGAVPLKFEADLTPLDIIKTKNFDQPIFECLTPQGEILPGQTFPVEWRFSPIEAKTYMVDIPIKVHQGETAIITFVGVGYDKRVLGDTMSWSDKHITAAVPCIHSGKVKEQMGCLSIERLSFGNLPLFSQARRMVFVKNSFKDRSIYFEWHVTSKNDSQLLNIYPVRGNISPKDSKMCRISFIATNVPAFYDLDLVCEIYDLQEFTKYKRELAAWEAERERQVNEFIITEDDLYADMRSPDIVNTVSGLAEGRVSRLEALADGKISPSDPGMGKYKTLPPIQQRLTIHEIQDRDRVLKKKLSTLWQKPQPQKPYLLHLGITARTHDHLSFQTNFPGEFQHFYIDRSLSKGSPLLEPYQQESDAPALTFVECSKAEAQIVKGVIGGCLRALLDDTSFIESAKKVMQEPIPYFCQFTSNLHDRAEEVEESQVTGNTGSLCAAQKTVQEDLLRQDSSSLDDDDSQFTSVTSASEICPEKEEQELAKEDDMLESIHEIEMTTLTTHRNSEMERMELEAYRHKETQAIKRLTEFGHNVEAIIENTIINLMSEALSCEFSIVRRPRLIAMSRKKVSDLELQSTPTSPSLN